MASYWDYDLSMWVEGPDDKKEKKTNIPSWLKCECGMSTTLGKEKDDAQFHNRDYCPIGIDYANKNKT